MAIMTFMTSSKKIFRVHTCIQGNRECCYKILIHPIVHGNTATGRNETRDRVFYFMNVIGVVFMTPQLHIWSVYVEIIVVVP